MKPRLFRFWAISTAFAAALGACVSSTPYQAAIDGRQGYSDQRIEEDRWAIAFAGNAVTDRQTVETYLLYRAAELTLESGYDHFQIVTRETDAETNFVSTGFGSSFNYGFYGFGHPHSGFRRSRLFYTPFDPFYGGVDVRQTTKYVANAEILMGRGAKPKGDADFFDAADVRANLAASILGPDTRR
ncbi:MAG: hypothetical protein AAFQ67_08265 [Pseudomonadota bacterium]